MYAKACSSSPHKTSVITGSKFVNCRQTFASSKSINICSASQKDTSVIQKTYQQFNKTHQQLQKKQPVLQQNLHLTMHFQIPIILAVGAGLASTMALPTINNSTLEKRDHYAWVSSFTNPTCSGNPDPKAQRPELTGGSLDGSACQAFQFVVGESIGVNFGSGIHQYSGVTFFSDAGCQTVTSLNDWHTVVPGSDGMACITPAEGTVVNSVIGTDYIG